MTGRFDDLDDIPNQILSVKGRLFSLGDRVKAMEGT